MSNVSDQPQSLGNQRRRGTKQTRQSHSITSSFTGNCLSPQRAYKIVLLLLFLVRYHTRIYMWQVPLSKHNNTNQPIFNYSDIRSPTLFRVAFPPIFHLNDFAHHTNDVGWHSQYGKFTYFLYIQNKFKRFQFLRQLDPVSFLFFFFLFFFCNK